MSTTCLATVLSAVFMVWLGLPAWGKDSARGPKLVPGTRASGYWNFSLRPPAPGKDTQGRASPWSAEIVADWWKGDSFTTAQAGPVTFARRGRYPNDVTLAFRLQSLTGLRCVDQAVIVSGFGLSLGTNPDCAIVFQGQVVPGREWKARLHIAMIRRGAWAELYLGGKLRARTQLRPHDSGSQAGFVFRGGTSLLDVAVWERALKAGDVWLATWGPYMPGFRPDQIVSGDREARPTDQGPGPLEPWDPDQPKQPH